MAAETIPADVSTMTPAELLGHAQAVLKRLSEFSKKPEQVLKFSQSLPDLIVTGPDMSKMGTQSFADGSGRRVSLARMGTKEKFDTIRAGVRAEYASKPRAATSEETQRRLNNGRGN